MCHAACLENPRPRQLHHQHLLLEAVHGPRQLRHPCDEHPQQQGQLPVTYMQMLWVFTVGELYLNHDLLLSLGSSYNPALNSTQTSGSNHNLHI